MPPSRAHSTAPDRGGRARSSTIDADRDRHRPRCARRSDEPISALTPGVNSERGTTTSRTAARLGLHANHDRVVRRRARSGRRASARPSSGSRRRSSAARRKRLRVETREGRPDLHHGPFGCRQAHLSSQSVDVHQARAETPRRLRRRAQQGAERRIRNVVSAAGPMIDALAPATGVAALQPDELLREPRQIEQFHLAREFKCGNASRRSRSCPRLGSYSMPALRNCSRGHSPRTDRRGPWRSRTAAGSRRTPGRRPRG